MRKIIFFVLAAVLTLSGCARVPAPDPELASPPTPTPSSPIVGFCQLGEESAWRIANTESIIRAAEDAGVRLMYENAQQKLENQIKALRSFIAYKVDAIVLAPIVEEGWTAVLQEAMDAGIPVILEDRTISDAPEGAVAAWTGSDFYAEGEKAAEFLLEKFRNTAGHVNIVELRGTEGSTAEDRGVGFRDTLGSRPRFSILRSVSGDFMVSKGREAMRMVLDQTPPDTSIDVIFSHNDDMAIGAIEALEERGITPGKDVIVISVDAQEKARELVTEGKIACAVECNPDIGPAVLDLVQKVLRGEEVPDLTYSEEVVYTADSGAVSERDASVGIVVTMTSAQPSASASAASSGAGRLPAAKMRPGTVVASTSEDPPSEASSSASRGARNRPETQGGSSAGEEVP